MLHTFRCRLTAFSQVRRLGSPRARFWRSCRLRTQAQHATLWKTSCQRSRRWAGPHWHFRSATLHAVTLSFVCCAGHQSCGA